MAISGETLSKENIMEIASLAENQWVTAFSVKTASTVLNAKAALSQHLEEMVARHL